MSRHGSRHSSFLAAVLFCTAAAHAQYAWPDPKDGVIEGRQAVMIWPSDASGVLQDPARCEVHLVAAAPPMEEQIYPCGRWFLPAGAGSFDFWVEQGTNISDSQRSMRYSDRPGASVGARATSPLTIQVVDAATRKPIGGATVAVTSAWHHANGDRRSARHVRTNDRGEVALPPLYPGVLELQASADGFMTGAPSTVAVPDQQPGPRKVVLELRAEGEAEKMAIALPDGTPAAGAEIVGLSTMQGEVIWRDTADEAGVVSIPVGVSVIAVRHPRAGCSIRASTSRPADIWTLPPPAPLTLRAVNREDQGVRGARIVIWIDGFRLTGPLLGFLTGSTPLTDGTGLWMAKNLPAQQIRVLFFGPEVDWATSETGAFDARAVTVRLPLQTPQNILVFE